MSQLDFSEAALDVLRNEIASSLSPYRFRHIAEVENTIVRLGQIYLRAELPMLRAAALLHDLTKEFSNETHESIFEKHGILLTDEMRLSPKLYHAVTAALEIPSRYPQFASPVLLDAVRYHTTGRAGMTIVDMLLFLADYIDESRTFDTCVRVRNAFWSKDPASMCEQDRLRHLYDTLILILDLTLESLIRSGAIASPDALLARNDLLIRKQRL